MAQTKLFTYGKLQPRYYPPTTMSAHQPDSVSGDLHELGNDPHLTNLGKAIRSVPGHTLTIDDSELPSLDKAEGHRFERVRTVTHTGQHAWVYVSRGVPPEAKRIDHWPMDRSKARG